MTLTQKIKTEVLKVYDTWLESYISGDVATYDSYLDDAYHFIGSTDNEEFLNRKDTTDFFRITAEQFAGKTELRNEAKTIEGFGELIFLTHVFDAWFLPGKEWSYYGRFRFTSALRETEDGWRFIYQHFSTPDSKAQEGETIGFDQISAENLQLREAIKRRTVELEHKNRELAIEAALERIRAQAMAMRESSDLLDIVVTMRSEFQKLGHEAHYFWHMRWLPDTYKKAMTSGDGTRIGTVMTLPRHIHGDIPLLDKWEKGNEPTVVYAMDAESAVDYVHKMVTLGDFQQVDPQAPTAEDIRHIGGITFVMARTTHGEIGFSLPGNVDDPPAEALETLVRFAGVFDLAYRRFEDLRESERQKREAEIELALEKVRSRTMAMQKSEELADAAFVLFEQLRSLGGNLWGTGFGLCQKDGETDQFWFAYEKGVLPPASVPNTTDPTHKKMYKGWNSKKDFLAVEASGEDLKKHYEYMMSLEEVRPFFQEILNKGLSFPEWQQWNAAYFTYGYLLVISLEPYPEPEVLKRFARVFDQTYTRFLDLKKVEAQARESEIQLALERVRASTMAMHLSEELSDVLSTLFEQFDILGINPSHAVLTLIDKEKNTLNFHTTGTDGYRVAAQQEVDLAVTDAWIDTEEKWKKSEPNAVNVNEYPPEVLPEVWEVYADILAAIPEKAQPRIEDFPDGLFITEGYCRFGYLGFAHNREPTEEEKDIVRRMASEFGTLYQRFLDLQKAEAQAREAQIEAALEKVRTRTMAMQKGEELKEVAVLLYKELIALGVTNFVTCGYVEVNEEIKRQFTWVTSPGGDTMGLFYLPLNGDATFDDRYAAWKRQQTIFHQTVAGEVRNNHLEYAITTFNSKEAEEMVRSQFPDPTVFYCFNFSHGYLHLVCPTVLKEEEEVLLARFTRVFEQTYARFLDLKKAEAQAREAQIEASLERVRSQTMAMHRSSDLEKSAEIVFEELERLNLSIERSGIGIFDRNKRNCQLWTTAVSQKGEKELVTGTTSLTIHPMLTATFDAWEAQESLSYVLEGKELKQYYDIVSKSEFILSDELLEKSASLPKEYYHYTPFGAGGLYFFSDSEPPAADIQIMHRFAEVFDMTYTRYEDLKKAESQAREAQIEAALEKVRSRTMAMQHSDELPQAANVLFLEIQALGIPAWSCGYNILATDKKSARCWMSSEGTLQKPFTLRLWGEASFEEMGDFVHGDETFLVQELGEKALKEHYDHMLSFPDLLPIFEALQAEGLSLPTYQINHLCKFNHGFLLFITYESVPEAHEIFKRFTAVFEQTYTRFLDLKNMEAQARESKIETALERVRARALAMQEPEELKEVVQVLRGEMGLLGVEELETSSIYVNDEQLQKAECWFAIKDLREEEKVMLTDHFELDLNDTRVGREMLEFYKSPADQVSIVMKGDVRKEWITYCESQSKAFKGYYGEVIPERTYHLYKFSHGAIGAATPGDLSEESWGLLKRTASVFSLAYSRFKDLSQARLDLKRLKEEKKRAEEALKELQLTQQQLVHSEKMASLGELTAGIAHEIQNPLNFVNNFSDVSRELIVELKEEAAKGLKERDAQLEQELLTDIDQNLEKISHHGKRADSIVKGMLQHSRSSDGKKEPTDLNALTDEYLRLAYHGLRAKDKSFNASMETNFDPALPKIEVVPQDIGRVLLNLITNAFHAVSERKEKETEEYEPTVWVKTRKTDQGVEISVWDNGGGIPEEIRDKIFQPFFTTKPTGEGTGLGLSMSYDIMTKGHGGQLNVKSKEGESTEFLIILPV